MQSIDQLGARNRKVLNSKAHFTAESKIGSFERRLKRAQNPFELRLLSNDVKTAKKKYLEDPVIFEGLKTRLEFLELGIPAKMKKLEEAQKN